MKNIQGCNAILTGASKGLGVHLAEAFARENVNMVLAARSQDLLKDVRRKISKPDIKVFTIPTDLTKPLEIQELVQKTKRKLGSVDILVNNAGTEFLGPYEEQSPPNIKAVVDINLLAPLLLSRTVLPDMLKQGGGHIVNISSLAGKIGLPLQTPYATSKAGLIMFSHSLRAELIDKPVDVSVVCPGFVSDSGMFARKNKNDVSVPFTLNPTSTDKVVSAVIKAIKQNVAELVVNPLPMRPVSILRETFTGITPYIHKVSGVTEFARQLSRENQMNK